MIECPLKEEHVTIVRNTGYVKTHWTIEISTKLSKREAEKLYTYLSLYHNYWRNSR